VLAVRTLDSPIGPLTIVAGPDGLREVSFESSKEHSGPSDARSEAVAAQAERELQEYLSGERREFNVPVAVTGPAFHRAVWGVLAGIPYGKTLTYGEIAESLGYAGAARAVGRANGLNPVAIVLPCHRVIGADGKLTGYAGGLWRKRWLLDLESGQRLL
jgi:methylated-DNA-[protein]-cysteine S-methyltransferase